MRNLANGKRCVLS